MMKFVYSQPIIMLTDFEKNGIITVIVNERYFLYQKGGKYMKRCRIAAFVTAFLMCLSGVGCSSGTAENSDGAVTTSESAEQTVTEESDIPDETDSFFGEDYDPFAEDYDPYGGGGAVTVTGDSAQTVTAAESEKEEKETEADSEKSDDKQETAAQTTAQTSAKTEEKQTEKKPSAEEKAPEKEASSEDVELIISMPNGWNDGTYDFSQLDGAVKNKSDAPVEGWTATIYVGSGASVEQSWNCEISLDNGKMTVNPVEHNKSI